LPSENPSRRFPLCCVLCRDPSVGVRPVREGGTQGTGFNGKSFAKGRGEADDKGGHKRHGTQPNGERRDTLMPATSGSLSGHAGKIQVLPLQQKLCQKPTWKENGEYVYIILKIQNCFGGMPAGGKGDVHEKNEIVFFWA
jgi:hypothetical protein